MEIQRFSKDMNIINSLPDQPTLTTDALKQKFDEGGIAIKDFLNGEGDYKGIGFADQIESFASEITTTVDTAITSIDTKINTDLYGEGGTYDTPTSDSPIGKIKSNVEETKTTIESEMSTLKENLETEISSCTTLLNGTFKLENHSNTYSFAGNHVYGYSHTIPSGYVFGGIVNKYRPDASDMSKDAIITCNTQCGASSGSITVNAKYTGNDAGNVVIGYTILWIKSGVIS